MHTLMWPRLTILPRSCVVRSYSLSAMAGVLGAFIARSHEFTRIRGRLSMGPKKRRLPPGAYADLSRLCSAGALALALLWHILSGMGFPNHFFCDSWVVGFWRGRPWRVGPWIGEQSLDSFSSHFWIGWVTKRGEKCVRSTCRD